MLRYSTFHILFVTGSLIRIDKPVFGNVYVLQRVGNFFSRKDVRGKRHTKRKSNKLRIVKRNIPNYLCSNSVCYKRKVSKI